MTANASICGYSQPEPLDIIRKRSDRRGKLLADIYNCAEAECLPAELKARIGEELFLTLP